MLDGIARHLTGVSLLYRPFYLRVRPHPEYQALGAIVLTAVKSGQAKSQATTVVVFAWMLFIFSAVSAFLASRPPPDSVGGFPVEEDETLGKTDYEGEMV